MKIKIFKIDFLIIILIFPFIIPTFFVRMEMISLIIKIWKLGTGLFAIAYLFKMKKIKNPVLILLSSFYLIMLVSAVIHKYSFIDILGDISFLWIINYLSEKKEIRDRFFKIYKFVMTIFITINLLTIILYPNGLYQTETYDTNWLLGYKNGIIRKIIPYLIIVFLNFKKEKFSWFEKIGILSSVGSVILCKSFNGYIGLVIFFVMFFILTLRNNIVSKKVGIFKIFALFTGLNIYVLFSNIITYFDSFIVDTLDKNGSMIGRFSIWNATFELIKSSPIIGYGNIDSKMYSLSFNITHPHNFWLYYLMLGGIVGIVIFAIVLIVIDKKCKNNRDNKEIQNTNVVFYASYFSYFAMGFLESLVGATFLIPFLLVMYNMNKEEKNDRDMYTLQNK